MLLLAVREIIRGRKRGRAVFTGHENVLHLHYNYYDGICPARTLWPHSPVIIRNALVARQVIFGVLLNAKI